MKGERKGRGENLTGRRGFRKEGKRTPEKGWEGKGMEGQKTVYEGKGRKKIE